MLFTVMLMSRTGHTKIKLQRASHPLLHPLQHNRLPHPSSFKMAKAMHYCNPPNSIEVGQEGKVPSNYSLEVVAVIIRHGDRSPLRPVRNQSSIDCSADTSVPMLKDYLAVLKSIRRTAKTTKNRNRFSTFTLYPSEKHCSSAQMTVIGAQQHLQLGHSLGSLYNGKLKLLPGNWSSDHFKVYSTIYSRTFQSAVAFLYGFLPSFNFTKIKFVPSADTRFCMNEHFCKCPLLDHLQKLIDKKVKKLLNSHSAVIRLLEKLNLIIKHHPSHSNITSPMSMFDSLMGYVCHGSHLPCIPGTHHCATIDHVGNLIAFLDWEGKQFVEDNTYKKASWLKMHGFLWNLLQHVENSLSGKNVYRFFLYSGHDVTLIPLASVLGFYDGITPPYASRIVFEVYSRIIGENKFKYAFKVLYNGKDVTKYISFCKVNRKYSNSTKRHLEPFLCPFENLVKFVRKDFFKRMNSTTFEAACDLLQSPSSPIDIKYSSYASESLNEV